MKAMPLARNIHVWIPNLFNFKGGIQVYSAFLLSALQSIKPDFNYQVLLKHDTHSDGGFLQQSNTNFYFTGCWPSFLRTSGFAAQLIGLGIWQKPNLVITTHLNFTVAAYWLKHIAGIPYWAVAHGVEAWDIQRPDLQMALRYADRILCVSGYTRDRLLKEQQLNPSKILLLPNTFDPDRFQICGKPTYILKRHGLTSDQPIILTVNRLSLTESYKGYDKVLDALPQIIQEIPNVHYIIVGKGDDRPRLEKLIAQHQLQKYVTLAGFIPDEELCNYYNFCDVFAMPSKQEGFGIVYLEALACGKPALGGNQDGAIDALCHGKLGALVEPDDVTQIAKTLIQILQGNYPNPILYQPEVLRQKIIDIYGFDRFKKNLSKYLEEFFSSPN
ncbi:MAG TPA: glycosyltransferase family 4 protein [Leptolyngbyaceae cyanobacterium]